MFGLDRVAALLVALVLVGTRAEAETYQILEGALSIGDGSESETLTGALDVSFHSFAFASEPTPAGIDPPEQSYLLVDDFAMQAGDWSFTPNPPLGYYDGYRLWSVQQADHIRLVEDDVVQVLLRSGGEVVASGEREVTFRFLDFREGSEGGGDGIGQLADGELPRRLQLEGTLYEVDRTFDLLERDLCTLPSPRPPPGGLGIISYRPFDTRLAEPVEIVQPRGTADVISRVTGGSSSIAGELREDGEVYLLASSLEFGPASASATPTLEELGITAPDGASVLYDDATGALLVASEGDLFIVFVEGAGFDLPGLTSVTIRTSGSITVTGSFPWLPEVILQFEAGGDVLIEGELEAPGDIVLPPPGPGPFTCRTVAWYPRFPPQERAVGSYSLVASAARQIDIDVQPRRSRNRVNLGIPHWIAVAILGSDDLDIRDIDETSLRLGPAEAEPTSERGRRPTRPGNANGESHLDLLSRFDVRDTWLAYGATELCLVAATTAGETLEGCDAIDTLPDRLRSLLDRARGQRTRGR